MVRPNPASHPALQSEVLAPRRRRLLVALSLGTAIASMTAATVATTLVALEPSPILRVQVELPAAPAPLAMVPAAAPPSAAPALLVSQAAPSAAPTVDDRVHFTLTVAGKTYVILETDSVTDPSGADESPAPDTDSTHEPLIAERIPHGAPKLLRQEDFTVGALASVQPAELSAEHAAWLGHRLVVDGTCEARVQRLVLLSLFSGEIEFVVSDSLELDPAQQAFGAGNVVLAGELDRCGEGLARSIEAPPVLAADELQDARLEKKARAAVLRSARSLEVQRTYQEEYEGKGDWWAGADVTARLVRHPSTGATLVSVQVLMPFECGGLEANLWGLYRVADGGALSEMHIVDLGSTSTLGEPIDIDGDGRWEWTASEVLSGPVLLAPNGAVLQRVAVPFFGCPC